MDICIVVTIKGHLNRNRTLASPIAFSSLLSWLIYLLYGSLLLLLLLLFLVLSGLWVLFGGIIDQYWAQVFGLLLAKATFNPLAASRKWLVNWIDFALAKINLSPTNDHNKQTRQIQQRQQRSNLHLPPHSHAGRNLSNGVDWRDLSVADVVTINGTWT